MRVSETIPGLVIATVENNRFLFLNVHRLRFYFEANNGFVVLDAKRMLGRNFFIFLRSLAPHIKSGTIWRIYLSLLCVGVSPFI